MDKQLTAQDSGELLEKVIIKGDLSQLTSKERVIYYKAVCESLGLNPLTNPFAYITLNGKLTLYATRGATDQLRHRDKVSITALEKELIDDVYVVTAWASTPDGRMDESTGAVCVGNLKGEQRANAIMKAETKAKRRVTLSIVGLGWLDESEIDSIPGTQIIKVNEETGEITGQAEPQGIAAQAEIEAKEADMETRLKSQKQGFANWPKTEQTNFWTWAYEIGLSMEATLQEFGVEKSMTIWKGTARQAAVILAIINYGLKQSFSTREIRGALEAESVGQWVLDGGTFEIAKGAIIDYTQQGDEARIKEGNPVEEAEPIEF